jgi:Flp pilus assembly protein TadD
VGAQVQICPGCDFILDASFLGNDILDEEDEGEAFQQGETTRIAFGPDSVILGDLQGASTSFLSSEGGVLAAQLGVGRVYIGEKTRAVMNPLAVVARKAGVDRRKLRLSPYERHVLRFIDGRRTINRVYERCGLHEAELRTTLALLKDKGAIELVEQPGPTHRVPTRPGPPPLALTEATREDRPAASSAGPQNVPTQIQEYDVHNQATHIHSDSAESLDISMEVADVPLSVSGLSSPLLPMRKEDVAPAPPEPVSHEMRRKAEKIFAQAEKDAAAGKTGSAYMNAKLAAIYNPIEKRYAEMAEQWERSAQAIPKPLAREPKEVILYKQAQAAETKGAFEDALKLLDEALALNSQAAPLHNARGVLLATRLKRFNEASMAIIRAIEIDPHNLAYKNNLGKVIAREEDADAASRLKHLAQQRGKPVKIRTVRPPRF